MKKALLRPSLVLGLSVFATISEGAADTIGEQGWMQLVQGLTSGHLMTSKASPIPEEFESAFALTFPQAVDEPQRLPASTQPVALATSQRSGASSASGNVTKSHIPNTVDTGFELRVRTVKDASTFWVVQRGVRHDLLFASSGGTKSSVSISKDQFSDLLDGAQKVQTVREPQAVADYAKCSGSVIQLFVVRKDSHELAKTFCVDKNHKPSMELDRLGQMVSFYAR